MATQWLIDVMRVMRRTIWQKERKRIGKSKMQIDEALWDSEVKGLLYTLTVFKYNI